MLIKLISSIHRIVKGILMKRYMPNIIAGLTLSAGTLLATCSCAQVLQEVPRYSFEIVQQYPHDKEAFTQGLLIVDGELYESTGLYEKSTVRRVDLASGEVKQSIAIAPNYFGEGLVNWKDRLINITWKAKTALVFDKQSLTEIGQFSYQGEGWGITQNGQQLIMSDGTPDIRFLDPETFKEQRRITVTYNQRPIRSLNELEWVNGEIYANVWQTDWILRIDPESGDVIGLVDMTGLLQPSAAGRAQDDVLNGIAYDAKQDRLFVTGKNWPHLFEIKLVSQ
jgi:glutaminyl-peptide cyclotransferase